LREIARAFGGRDAFGEAADFSFRGGQRLFDGKEARHHALDIAVDRSGAPAEGDRRDRGCRVGADARQARECRLVRRKPAIVAFDHGPRAGVQVARPRVIAEPGPRLEHVVERACGQRGNARPALEKACIIGCDRFDGCLLQHDFGKPDPVRIGLFAGRGTPRQRAPMPVVPGEQNCGVGTARGLSPVALRC
jgi:hypothetical protein